MCHRNPLQLQPDPTLLWKSARDQRTLALLTFVDSNSAQ
jgi:hypothetical protein